MSHTEIIWIVSTLTFATIFGPYVAIKLIKRYTRPHVNTLVRTGDIELLDYIEPTRPNEVYYPDLIDSQSHIQDRITSLAPTYWSGTAPTYQSGTLPSYQTVDRWYISSFLENGINLSDILILFILGVLFFMIINNYSAKHEKIVFTKGISNEKITLVEDYQELLNSRLGEDPGYFIIYKETYNHILNNHWTIFDIKDWLESLNEQDYAVTFDLVTKTSEGFILNNPKITLSKELIVNKHSNPAIISTLISTQLQKNYNLFNFEYNENHFIVIRYTVLMSAH